MKQRIICIAALMAFVMGLQAQNLYICQEKDVETAQTLSFSNGGSTVNGTLATDNIDSITTHVPDMQFVGADLSMLTKYETQGATYFDSNGQQTGDLLAWLKRQGWNTIRVRLFVDPSEDSDKAVIQDLDYVIPLAKRIKDTGLLLMLDFHYSDTWADPGKQWTPAEWLSLSDAQLQAKIYEYTKDCLHQLNAAGASPDFIQTGNEISYGMLWGANGTSANRCYTNSSSATWDRFINLLKQAVKACREECPRAQIIIHSERTPKPDVLTDFFNRMKTAALDYDIIGLSYYPYFHGNLATLETAIRRLETNGYGKKIQIVETGYPSQWAVPGTTYDYTGTYPYSVAGQKSFIADLVTMLKKHPQVNGLSWWYAEANAKGCKGDLSSGWYNAGLFDNSTGRALDALYELKNFK